MNCYDTGSVGSVSHSFMYDYVTPWTVARQALLSMGFFRQEYWNRLLFPSPGEYSQPRDQTQVSCMAGRFSTTVPPSKPYVYIELMLNVLVEE